MGSASSTQQEVIHMASALDEQQCDLCRKRDVTKKAKFWCFECSKFFCIECSEIHQAIDSFDSHTPIQITDYLKLKPAIRAIKYNCDQHEAKFEYYCGDHDTPICVKCVTEIHKTCTNVKPLTEITKNIKDSFLFTDLQERASDIQIIIQEIIRDLSITQSRVKEEKDWVISTVRATRKNIDRHLDLLQIELMRKIKKNENELNDQITRDLTNFQKLLGSSQEILDSFAQACIHASNLHTLCGIKIWNFELKKLESELSSLQKNLQYFERFELNLNQKLSNFHTDVNKFASLKVGQINPVVKLLAKERQGQLKVSNNFKPNIALLNTRSFTVSGRKNPPVVRGCCIMESGTLILADEHNQRLFLVDKTGELSKNINLPFPPLDVVEVDDHIVGVTSLWGKKVLLVDINQGRVIRTVYEGDMCYGLCYTDRKFIVIVNKKIKVIDLGGEVLSTIDMVADAVYCCVADNKLFYTAGRTDTVYCCDMEGKVRWKYTCDKGDYPFGVAVDNKGHILVTCYKGHKVIALALTGKESIVLLSQKDGMEKPTAIAHSKKHNTVLVANESDGKCFVYNVK